MKTIHLVIPPEQLDQVTFDRTSVLRILKINNQPVVNGPLNSTRWTEKLLVNGWVLVTVEGGTPQSGDVLAEHNKHVIMAPSKTPLSMIMVTSTESVTTVTIGGTPVMILATTLIPQTEIHTDHDLFLPRNEKRLF